MKEYGLAMLLSLGGAAVVDAWGAPRFVTALVFLSLMFWIYPTLKGD